jgi:phosphatidylinositol alpha-1,6-mannosyltransferase
VHSLGGDREFEHMSLSRDIAIISDDFPPCKGGGIAEWALGIAQSAGERGHRVRVYSRWKHSPDLGMHGGRPFSVTAMRGRNWNQNRYWFSLFYLWRFLRSHPEGIILAATWELGRPFVFLKRFFPRARLVVAAHGLEVTKIEKAKRLKQLRQTLESALFTLAVSRFTRNSILEMLARPDLPVLFVPNGVDSGRFKQVEDLQELRSRWNLTPDTKVIITLARIIRRKGHDVVIRALPEILEAHPQTVYLIGGPVWQADYQEELVEMIKGLDLEERVIFTGFIADEDLCRIYSMSDLYVMVSNRPDDGDSEGFGITFLEANACGCPVIGSRSGGIEDAVEDGVNGVLVEPNDSEGLAREIIALFDDPGRLERLGEMGRKRVEEQFTWAKITDRILGELESRIP